MRAARYHEYGPPEVLRVEEVPDPEPGPDEVLIRVAAAGVNYGDTQLRGGTNPEWYPRPSLPTVAGGEVAGTVLTAGPGADPDLVGRRVLAFTGNSGGYAELAVVPARTTIAIPDGMSEQHAVALLIHGVTAAAVIDAANIQPGERVLVEAAAGGVGSLLVQWAKHAGAVVVAAARGERKLAVAKRLGADVVVDYAEPDWDQRVRDTLGGDLQVVLESVGGELARTAFELLEIGMGRMLFYGLASGAMPEITPADVLRRGVTLIGVGQRMMTQPDYLVRLRGQVFELAAAGHLEPVIGQVLPLAEAVAAHRAFEERTVIGKTVLVP
jgi:NADPH2:quinone reductase